MGCSILCFKHRKPPVVFVVHLSHGFSSSEALVQSDAILPQAEPTTPCLEEIHRWSPKPWTFRSLACRLSTTTSTFGPKSLDWYLELMGRQYFSSLVSLWRLTILIIKNHHYHPLLCIIQACDAPSSPRVMFGCEAHRGADCKIGGGLLWSWALLGSRFCVWATGSQNWSKVITIFLEKKWVKKRFGCSFAVLVILVWFISDPHTGHTKCRGVAKSGDDEAMAMTLIWSVVSLAPCHHFQTQNLNNDAY